MVDIGGGMSLHVHCVGAGSPMVVLDECAGCDATAWQKIQPGIGRFTRACAYDRAGVGYSDPPPSPHLSRQMVDELRRLLGERDESSPLVLVGQGTGGFIDQVYARDFPRSVVGMVLVDTATQDYGARYYAKFPPEAIAKLRAGDRKPPENTDFDDQLHAMDDLMKAPLSLGDRPLVVVTHGKHWAPLYGMSDEAWNKLEAIWFAMQRDVTSLSRNSLHVIAGAEWIPEEAPDDVVDAVWEVLSSAKTGVPLSRLTAKSPPAAAVAATVAPSPTQGVPAPVDDGMVDIGGGMSLHIHCVGHGVPTVVMDNGHGADAMSWSKVLGDIGRLTRACVYDHPGIGFSSRPAPRQHSSRQMVRELHALLERADVAGPYVLVGHSLAGVDVRLFQAEHPEQVVGMVLVDTTTEDTLPTKPDESRSRMRDDVEGVDYDTLLASIADLRASSRSFGDMPLVVLTSAGKHPVPPGMTADQVEGEWRKIAAGHERIAQLSTNSTHVIAERSGHFIQLDDPQLVIASVKQVVDAVRERGRVDGKALEPFAHDGPLPPHD